MSKRKVAEGRLTDKAALKISRTGHEVDRDDLDTVASQDVEENQNQDYKNHHTLESDEEEDEKYQRLDMEKVEGQEDATQEYEGEVKITPFNMKDEMGEGHFDNTGNFIFDKKKEQVADAWLDGIDWSQVKKKAGTMFKGSKPEDEEKPDGGIADDDEEEEFDAAEQRAQDKRKLNLNRRQVYESMLQFLIKPNETVTRALKRLGGGMSAEEARKQRWLQKKKQTAKKAEEDAEKDKNDGVADEKKEPGKLPDTDETETSAISATAPESDEPESDVARLTALVDELVAAGEYEAYSFTKEKLQFELAQMETAQAGGHAATTADDDGLDMFSDDIPSTATATATPSTPAEAPTTTAVKRKAKTPSSAEKRVRFQVPDEDEEMGEDGTAKTTSTVSSTADTSETVSDTVTTDSLTSSDPGTSAVPPTSSGPMWEFKWKNEEGADLYGPYTSKQMMDWQEQGYFKDDVFVRKVHEDAAFYSAKRIDFDLYVD